MLFSLSYPRGGGERHKRNSDNETNNPYSVVRAYERQSVSQHCPTVPPTPPQFHLLVQDRYDCNQQIQGEEYENTPKLFGSLLTAKAFFSVARLRHVNVDPGFHTIDRQAWRYCRSLQIVKLPDTVVAIEYAAFQGCYALVMVEMPGCVKLGVRLFSECCALERVGVIFEG